MRDDDRFSALIRDIYDAALDPSRWVTVLARTSGLVDGPAAALYSTDVANKIATVAYVYGMDPRYEKLYHDKYIKFDPVTTGYNFSEIGTPIAAGDLLRYDEFLETRFHREWMRPQGLATASMPYWTSLRRAFPCSAYPVMSVAVRIAKRVASRGSLSPIFDAPRLSAEVGGVPEVAEALGVAETTVKTHLSRLYQKIGVRRQADLVKVVAGFTNPFRGSSDRMRALLIVSAASGEPAHR
jgi:hypothetical protein